jgi:hypothetical protein
MIAHPKYAFALQQSPNCSVEGSRVSFITQLMNRLYGDYGVKRWQVGAPASLFEICLYEHYSLC